MATYNCLTKEVPENTMTVTGTSALAVLSRKLTATGDGGEEGTPSSAELLTAKAEAGQRAKVKVEVPSGLATELGSGAKIVKAIVRVNVKSTANKGKQVKITTNSPAAEATPEELVATSQEWVSLELTKLQSEELTKAKLEALEITAERAGGQPKVYEIYLHVETEAGGAVGTLAGSTKILLGGTARIGGSGSLRGTASVRLGGTAQLGATGAIAGKASVVIGSSARLGAVAGIASSTVVRIGQSATVAARGAVAATTIIRLGGTQAISGTASGETGKLAGATKVVIGGKAQIVGRGALGSSTKIKLGGTFTIKGVSSATRRTVIFLFEE